MKDIPVLDFTAGRVRYVSHSEWIQERDEDCRRANHIFVSVYPGRPAGDAVCLCGDAKWKELRR